MAELKPHAGIAQACRNAAQNMVGNDKRNLLAYAMKLEAGQTNEEIFDTLQPGSSNKDKGRQTRAWANKGKDLASELGISVPESNPD